MRLLCSLMMFWCCAAWSDDYRSLVYETATEFNINPLVFHSLITQESGDPKRGLKLNAYAINIAGISKYPNSRLEAYGLILDAIGDGHDSVGVGLGQIEWRYHSEKFMSLWDALEPKKNVEVAARYLKEMVRMCGGNVACGVSAYHSMTKPLGKKYLALVSDKCRRLYNQEKCNEIGLVK